MPLLKEEALSPENKLLHLSIMSENVSGINGYKTKRLSSLPTHLLSKNSVEDHLIYNKDRCMKMNVLEYQKSMQIPKIKIILNEYEFTMS